MKFAIGEGECRLDIGLVPIIFIAYSIGGLIVKKAIIIS